MKVRSVLQVSAGELLGEPVTVAVGVAAAVSRRSRKSRSWSLRQLMILRLS